MFAAALLLAAFIARELWSRRGPALTAPEARVMPAALNVTRPPLPAAQSGPRTEQAVSGVAPIKLTRVQRAKPKAVAVPVPQTAR